MARSVCNEGMSLFSAFVMLLNYQRFGKMKGMCEIVEWSIRDETCFTPETEILTEIGWVSFEDLSCELKVAQYNSSNGEISFVKPQSYIDKHYKGDLVSFKSAYKFDLTATANHDLLYLHTYSDGLVPKKVRFDEFQPHYRKKIIVSGRKVGGRNTLTALDKFRIALQADGSIDYRINGKFSGCRASTFTLKKERKIQRLLEIVDSLGWDYTKSSVSERGTVSIRIKSPAQIELSKTFNWVELDKISNEWAEDFLYELGHWDGHFVEGKEEHITYVTTEKFNLDLVQALSVISGWSCTVGIRFDDRKDTYSDCYVANLHADSTFKATGNVHKTITHYEGRVMCVSVPTGNIIVRQNNRAAIVGNCHVEGMTKLFHTYLEENPELVTDNLKKYIYTNFEKAVELEDSLIEFIYGSDIDVEGLKKEDVKTYIRYLADRRLLQLGLKPIYKQKDNPLTWLDWVVSGDSFKNFFEGTVTDYNADGMKGDWGW
jgi:ribonucleoside-diphosphate reductase beta chain